MRKNKIFQLFFVGFVFVLGYLLGQKDWWFLREMECNIAKTLFGEQQARLVFQKDIDSDKIKEEIRFMVRKYPSKEQCSEGWIEVLKGKKKYFSSEPLGSILAMANIYDINKDGTLEIVSKWEEPTVSNLFIYSFDNENGFHDLLFASGKEVKLCDLDNDGIVEVVAYYRDYEKASMSYLANLYKWNGKEYFLWKEQVPLFLGSTGKDRLIIGKGKEVQLP